MNTIDYIWIGIFSYNYLTSIESILDCSFLATRKLPTWEKLANKNLN